MRIVSLVPSATEVLFALGLGEEVVGVTHECDFPEEAQELPALTRNVVPEGLAAREVDAAVRALTLEGRAIYELDQELLAELEPDLIVTQALCSVCAVDFEDVRRLAEELPGPPRVISLDPRTLGEVLGDVGRVAQAAEHEAAGAALVAEAADRIEAVERAVEGAERRRTAVLEWLDPPFAAGHWTPQMVEMAGGEDVLGHPGEHSAQTTWETIEAAAPEIVIIAPCGFDAARAYEEAVTHAERLAALGARRIVAVDAAAYFSRPGPRLVEGLELLAHVLHPELMPEAAGTAIDVEL